MKKVIAVMAVVVMFVSGGLAMAADPAQPEASEQAHLNGLIAECEKQAVEVGADDIDAFVGECVNDKLNSTDSEQS